MRNTTRGKADLYANGAGDLLGCFHLRGQQGGNTLIGPGIVGMDFSVFKNNRIKLVLGQILGVIELA
jgi:hypothetical protein